MHSRKVIAASALFIAACGGSESTGPLPPAELEAVSVTEQTTTVGSPVPTKPSVRVVDVEGNGVAGVTVVFEIIAGGGSITGGNTATASDGIAAVADWVLGTTVGTNTVRATVSTLSGHAVTFNATAVAGEAAALAVPLAGVEQTAPVGTAVAVDPRVTVLDAHGNPVPGVTVNFVVAGGGGSVVHESSVTSSEGTATAGTWTLGTNVGTNSLVASVEGIPSTVTFTATAIAGPPAFVDLHAGNAQTATIGDAVPVAPAVRVTDEYGNPVSEVTVAFTVTAGGGSVTGPTALTTSDGIATVGSWTLGMAAGANALEASVVGTDATTGVFEATGKGTPVCGIISASTTWSGNDAPFVLTCLTQIAYGAALTIEPAVNVVGRNQSLEVWGNLDAVGSAQSPVQFTDVHIVPRGRANPLEPFVIHIEHATIQRGSLYKPTGHAVYGRIEMRDSRLSALADRFYLWYPEGKSYIERNVFDGAFPSGGLSIGAMAEDSVFIRHNFFRDNAYAVENWASYGGEAITLEGNTFFDTDRVMVRVATDGQLSAAGNYWNTTDPAVIESMIFDRNDDLGAPGVIPYQPFLQVADPSTPVP